MPPIRILIADDHTLMRQGLRQLCEGLGGFTVVAEAKDGARAVAFESCSFPNLNYEVDRFLGPGEIVRITADGYEQLRKPLDKMQICAFLWVYYGYPASTYEGINTEATRYRSGAALARRDATPVDVVAGIPDSGTGHAIGYAAEAGIRYGRPFVKYTPTWPRSFSSRAASERVKAPAAAKAEYSPRL